MADRTLVPHAQQSDPTSEPSNLEEVLSPTPISTVSPNGELIYSMASLSSRSATPTTGVTTPLISDPFDFTLSEACMAPLLRIEPIMKAQSAGMKHKKLRRWVDLPERLTGWQVEKSPRPNGKIFDKFYHHPCIAKVRAITEVQFFIKYGFVPVKDTGKRKRDEPSLEEATEPAEKADKFYISMEKKLLASCDEDMADVSQMVNDLITDQLGWTKRMPSPPTATPDQADANIPEPVEKNQELACLSQIAYNNGETSTAAGTINQEAQQPAGTNVVDENVAAPPSENGALPNVVDENVAAAAHPSEDGALPNVVQQTNEYLSLLDPLTFSVDRMFADANRDDPMLYGFPGPIHFPSP